MINLILKLLVLSTFGFIIIASCSEKNTLDPIQNSSPTNGSIPNIKPKGNEKYLTNNSDYIYDQEKVKTYELIIKNDDLSALNYDPTKEEYVEAALVFEGDTISPVGVRYKGSIGAYAGCLSNPNWMNPSGQKICEKLSMQIKINWKGRNERFYDVNKLQFHSQNYDKSQLRERLAYWFFAQMGVPAPRSVHARLIINRHISGLYGLTEEIDNRFAEYFFKEGKGNIYKEVWPLKANGETQSDIVFINALKTNEEEKNVNFIKEFSKELSNTNTSNLKKFVEQYMDIDKTISHIVVDRAIRHDDGPFHWYCGTQINSCGNHNYYWFEDKKNKKMHLIPWDMDGTFEHIIKNANDITAIVNKWGEVSNNCEPFSTYINFNQRSAACEKLTSAWVGFDVEYRNRRKFFVENFIKNEKALLKIDTWAKQIEPFIIEADYIHNVGISNIANKKTTTPLIWQNATTILRSQVRAIQ